MLRTKTSSKGFFRAQTKRSTQKSSNSRTSRTSTNFNLPNLQTLKRKAKNTLILTPYHKKVKSEFRRNAFSVLKPRPSNSSNFNNSQIPKSPLNYSFSVTPNRSRIDDETSIFVKRSATVTPKKINNKKYFLSKKKKKYDD